MTVNSLRLPLEIPWKLIGASADMMDTRFCNKQYPYRWRSSLAMYLYEPPPEEQDERLCGQRIAFVKVAATVAGYQPNDAEVEEAYTSFPTVPTEEISRLVEDYWGCYGVQLNVAVFPQGDTIAEAGKADLSFAGRSPGQAGTNPIDIDGVVVGPTGSTPLRFVSVALSGGAGVTALAIDQGIKLFFPAASTVGITVMRPDDTKALTARTFLGSTAVAMRSASAASGVEETLHFSEGEIDTLIIESDNPDAVLVDAAFERIARRQIELADYPHIIGFEPKTRDLYQVSTETSEILSASVGKATVGKSHTQTDTTETGFSGKVGGEVPVGDAGKVTGEVGMSRTRTRTDEDGWTVDTDASRERRETEGASTQLSQLYNLLSGYHAGTNRALFMMLPRPHALQPTLRRTFVQGLRAIEGVQEFLLIVSRPERMDKFCLEATLETGHFPEKVEFKTPEPQYEFDTETFKVAVKADGGLFSGETVDFNEGHDIESGWVINRDEGDPGHSGVEEIRNDSDGTADATLGGYNYGALSDGTAYVRGRINGRGFWNDAFFDRTYRVHKKRLKSEAEEELPGVETDFLITGRALCMCVDMASGCPEVTEMHEEQPGDGGKKYADPHRFDVVYDGRLRIDPRAYRRSTDGLYIFDNVGVNQAIQRALASGTGSSSRIPYPGQSFLDTRYFARGIGRILGEKWQATQVAEVAGAGDIAAALGERTIGEVLALDNIELARRAAVSVDQVRQLRRNLLGLKAAQQR